MKVLREETTIMEELPISFITDYISKGWEEVGYLKEANSAIVSEYSNTEKIEQAMQDLMDAYLIFIGQMESYLHDKENISTEDVDAPKAVAPKHELPEAEIDIEPISEPEVEDVPVVEDEFEEVEVIEDDEDAEMPVPAQNADKKAPKEAFEFFVDFDEPDMSQPGVSEEELYGEEDSEQAYNRLRSQI